MTLSFTSAAVLLHAATTACISGVDLDHEGSLDSSDGALGTASEPEPTSVLDPAGWIGVYHFEHPDLPLGERGDPHGTYSLVNFELHASGRATVVFDDCHFDHPLTHHYRWAPSLEPGWLELQPGPSEYDLRLLGIQKVDTLRIELLPRDHALRFEADGEINPFFVFWPGESCWIDRCTTPSIMQVDYCEGERPEH